MAEPTMGRTVFFDIRQASKRPGEPGSLVTQPGMIGIVHSPTCINGTVFPDANDGLGGVHMVTSALERSAGDPPKEGTWHWPPRAS